MFDVITTIRSINRSLWYSISEKEKRKTHITFSICLCVNTQWTHSDVYKQKKIDWRELFFLFFSFSLINTTRSRGGRLMTNKMKHWSNNAHTHAHIKDDNVQLEWCSKWFEEGRSTIKKGHPLYWKSLRKWLEEVMKTLFVNLNCFLALLFGCCLIYLMSARMNINILLFKTNAINKRWIWTRKIITKREKESVLNQTHCRRLLF